MTTKRIIQLPFSGFYETMWGGAIDHCLDCFSEYNSDDFNEDNDDVCNVPSHDFCFDLLFKNTNFESFRVAIAKKYVTYFKDALRKDVYLGLDLSSLEFSNLCSPREYNYRNDDLYATIADKDIEKMFSVSAKDNHEKLGQLITQEFSHRNGFISHYSNNLKTWLKKPLIEWDHNELGTLLKAVCRLGDFDENIQLEIFENWPDSFSAEFYPSVNWPVVDAALEVERNKSIENGVK